MLWRIPEIGARALREGRRRSRSLERHAEALFLEAAQALLRGSDRLAHRVDSEEFVAYLGVRGRSEKSRRVALPVDLRGALERIAARLHARLDLPVEVGWTYVAPAELARDPQAALQEALQRGDRERERVAFLSAVGHELRTPLSSIRGYIETLLDAPHDAPTARRFLEIAQSEALRMARLVDGVLEFSLLDCSALHLADACCDLAAVARRAVRSLEPAITHAGARLDLRGATRIDIALDEDAAMHVVLNVIQNALVHGSHAGAIVVSLGRCRPFARLRIDDDGPGIPPELRKRIFQRGVRIGVGDRPGFGLGLAIVESIVARVGGEVRVGDAPLGGARFEILLPLQAEKGGAES
ncbi:MAG: HAMP domain-containing sensor histidine kinase [Candidatus Eremiobacteraeota bacterium]|nr:HAMP domain-containing sensor histidine kinase [Candidatus Eremiobacteraeota bacterium]